MLHNFFDNLRTKPKVVRDQYALLGAVCLTLMIGGMWSLSIPARLSTMATNATSTSVASAPMSGLFTQLKNQFKSARTAVVLPSLSDTPTTTPAVSGAQADSPTSTIRFGTTTIAPANRPDAASTTATTSLESATTSSF
jgi:hypothetical protein